MSGGTVPLRLISLALLFSLIPPARASYITPEQIWTNKWDNCLAAVGARYQAEPLLLKATFAGESSLGPGTTNINKDKKTGEASSTDYGLMQINPTHIPELMNMGVIKKSEDLITKPYLSTHIGNWVLARHFQICDVSWSCLGPCNAGFCKNKHETKEQYANKIWRICRDMKGVCLPGQGGRQCRQS